MSHDTGLIGCESTVLTAAVEPRATERPEHACLIVIFGAEIGRRVQLTTQETSIGRSSSASLQLDIDNVSRAHAVIRRTSRGYVLADLDSTNGTFVNDQPVRERALRDGDQIRIGRAMLKFLMSNNVEARYHEEIYRLMTLDGLTELYNRRYFQDALEREFARSRRYRHPFSVALLDIDHFKQINDRYGHQAGDEVLRKLAAVITSQVRTNDIVARIGGEEFALILPETTRAGGLSLAEKLRLGVSRERFGYEGQRLDVTISVGVSEFSRALESTDALLKSADARLYEAKAAGRNRVR